MDCGPTCLRMIAKHYGKSINIDYLRELTNIGKDGVNLFGISTAAEQLGFRARAVKLTYSHLITAVKLPVILHWQQNHFVVLHKVKKKTIYIADPSKGLMTYNTETLRQSWITEQIENQEVGIALLLDPSPNFYSLNESTTINNEPKLNFFLKYLTPYKKLIIQLFVGMCAIGILQLFVPFLTQSLVDLGITTGDLNFVYVILLAQLALFIGRITVDIIRAWLLLHICSRINVSILSDFLIKIMRLSISFFESKSTGDLLQRMSDHKRIESFLTGPSLNVLFSLFNLVIYSIVIAIFDLSIFGIFLFASLVYTGWVLIFLKKRKQLDYKHFAVAAKEQSTTIQLIHGMQEIKLNGIEQSMRWNWEKLQAALFILRTKSLSLNQTQQIGAFIINESKNILITFLSAKAVIDGELTLGEMLAIQFMLGQLNSPIEQLVGFIQNWQNAKISMERLSEIHNITDEEPHQNCFVQNLEVIEQKNIKGKFDHTTEDMESFTTNSNRIEHIQNNKINQFYITFNNVSFTYSGAGNKPVLKDLSFQIPIGKTTAIVGLSGSGKTTILKLLLKFHTPKSGDITVGETSLSAISHRYWRSKCGVVMQDSYIFSDTIARNIALGSERINKDRLNYAAKMANIKEFIDMLPLGFNTLIGAEGNSLSMGQRQRILIARAVYRDPDFILFDEATNSLDSNNETQILQNLKHFFKNKTVLVVAHRLSTVKEADQIVVVNNGEISERGTHQELIRNKGVYFSLIKNQLELD